MTPSRPLIVAAVQMTCQDGKVAANLEHASDLLASACQQGAELIVFPELMPQGYELTPAIWSAGESVDGPTSRWLQDQARQFRVYLGTSFLECDGRDFWNTFALASPDGEILGRIRKRFPSIWEAYFFKGYYGSHSIDTPLGRVGVGICFDNHTYAVAQAIADSQVDLMLMPHSYCTPTVPSSSVSQADIDRLNENPIRVAHLYNDWFGVPVILVNKSGPWNSLVPKTIFGQPKNYHFSGRSLILDGGGRTCAQRDDTEGVAVGEIHLDPGCKKRFDPPQYSRYIYPGPAGRELLRLIEWFGARSYERNKQRERIAQNRVVP